MIKHAFTFSLLAVAAFAAAAPTPAPDRGRSVLELPPLPGNPRNSEGAFLATRDGGLVFIYSHFLGASSADHAKARLAARRSTDGGVTWGADEFIDTPGEREALNVMSVSLVRLGNGDAGMFYLLRHSWRDMRLWLRRSADDGRTWGEPVCVMPVAGYYVVNNDRAVRLASGRLVVPAALHRNIAAPDAASSVDWRGVAEFFLSDDDGRTWRRASGYCTLPSPHTRSGLQEPGVIELSPGHLWGWARTDLGRQYEFFSRDGGETWSVPEPSRFTSPNSPLSMKHVPGTDRVLAVWNPGAAFETRPVRRVGGDRTPLVFALGQSPTGPWTRATILDGDDPAVDAGFCYTAIHFTPDAVLLAYCAGSDADRSRLARTRIRRVPLTALK